MSSDLATNLTKIGLRATAAHLDDFIARATRARLAPRALLEQIAEAEMNDENDPHLCNILHKGESFSSSMVLIGGFAALALVLGAVGIYGVIAYAVSMRQREIGVRMVLGAAGGDVLRMVLREGMLLATVGIGTGVALALALGRLARTLLFGIEPHDPMVLMVTALALAVVAFAATTIPARRAARVDPLIASRGE